MQYMYKCLYSPHSLVQTAYQLCPRLMSSRACNGKPKTKARVVKASGKQPCLNIHNMTHGECRGPKVGRFGATKICKVNMQITPPKINIEAENAAVNLPGCTKLHPIRIHSCCVCPPLKGISHRFISKTN